MSTDHKATTVKLLDFHSAPMRAFHMAWLAFFLCFFGWFGLAPLMPVIRNELHLTKEQIGNSAIAAVARNCASRSGCCLPSRVFWLACNRNPCPRNSFPADRSEI